MKPDELFRSISQRFTERASGRQSPAASELWDEALRQHKEGWPHAPICISDDGRALNDRGEVLNLVFRFFGPPVGGRIELSMTFATRSPIGKRPRSLPLN